MRSKLLACALALSLPTVALAGDIEGSVTIKSQVRAFKRGQKKQESGYEGDKAGSPTDNENECVVVMLEGPGLKCTPMTRKSGANTMTQRQWQFRPHVLAVTRGSKVYFKNEDNFIHRVYSISEPAQFDFRGFKGERPQDFEKSGEVEIFCGIHTKMNAYVVVADNDFFSVADGKGHFKIANVPPGTYTLKVWHPRIDSKEQKVTVPASGNVKLDVTL